ncbi:multiple monosaccharide ABC transporter substrate-binding protein [Acetanaerobacterium elongatum]|uniref:Monosaccharide ABC transporter substrate-binding protein, CUT2 family n=1 Tax=Acetanaerobacterium elongatum TaxID=258515 RepID=A0A1H0AHR5_9FIRM|nr:monosaccharide ABC transporter substrate-binding protein, CUT2 family [Acetanaerobacterium elongatum]
MKKVLAVLLVAIMMLTLASCAQTPSPASSAAASEAASSAAASEAASTPAAAAGTKIGISMPTQSLQRWNQDGANMKAEFEKAGYTVDLQYAGDNDIPTQVSQIENMITGDCKVLVIAAIDGSSLTEVLKTAKEKKISVIAYDRLIMNSDAVSYYATFDNTKVGTIQGEYIRDTLKLDTEKGPFNIELFTGDPADNNVNFFFGGAMSVLQPYIDKGVLVVKSGQTTLAQCATPSWSTEESQKRMENLITANNYGPKGTKLDAVLSSNDSVANGITNALVAAGYTKDNFPILTGQGCGKPAVKNMIAGLQSMSIFKDTRTLASKVVEMVNAIVAGKEVPVNDTKTYNNGIAVIPSFLCDPVFATVDNYKKLLIDSKYYTEADLA